MCPKTHYWLDLGNNAECGQFVLGQPENAKTKMPTLRSPTVAELYPEIVNPKLDRKDKLPACSAAESLDRQEPFVNQTLAYQALAMLARCFAMDDSPITAVLSISLRDEWRPFR
jgi:hypothetical protein